MNQTHVAIAATTVVVTLVNRKIASKKLSRVESKYLDRLETAHSIAFNNGFGEGHRVGVNAERLARIESTIAPKK